MSKYGIPYMGSKAKIIEQIIQIFPRADIEDSRFRCVWNEPKRSLLSADNTVGNKIEKVYVNRTGYAALLKGLKHGQTS